MKHGIFYERDHIKFYHILWNILVIAYSSWHLCTRSLHCTTDLDLF